MNEPNRVEVIDRDGWRKEFPLPKTLLYIGSGPGNDVTLDPLRGGGVEMRHLQLIPANDSRLCYRMINLSESEIVIGSQRVSPRSLADLQNGDIVQLGEFRLTFRIEQQSVAVPSSIRPAVSSLSYEQAALQAGTVTTGEPATGAGYPGREAGLPPNVGTDQQSPSIGLRLTFTVPVLGSDRPCDGFVTVRNQGDRAGVQFRLALEGLEPDCYTIGPSPILFPNAEKDVFIRLLHPRGPVPPSGQHVIRVHATAPEAYPAEVSTISQVVQVMPHYSHKLRIITS